MVGRNMKDIPQKLECLDIAHSCIHHKFHISAKFDDIEIFGHPPDHRDTEQDSKSIFFTNFRGKEDPTQQSKSCNDSKNKFPLCL